MPTEIERAPNYVEQAETLLGTQAFYDDEREDQLHAGTLKFTAESAGMRGLLYARTLRLLAQAANEREFDERRASAFRPSRLGRFALEHLPEVVDIARQLAVINTAEQTIAEQESSFFGGLRSHQHPYLHDVISFMDTAPSKIRVIDETGPYEAYIRGATVEAPTGAGKTVLMARTLVALGVGKPIENVELNQDRIRALIIVPTQTLVEQMTGRVGDDTLRRFAPGVEVGGYYQHEKDDTADAVAITIDQFTENFRDGMLNGQRFDICIIDEAHHATQPLLQRTLLKHWKGGPIIGFTATPEYYPGKDVRDLLPHRIFHGDILDFIHSKEDILNAAQLFEIQVTYNAYIVKELLEEAESINQSEINQLMLREATAEYLTPQIAEGRRGIIFCEQGGGEPSGYAKKLAARLRELTRPDGTPLRVAVAGSINSGKSRHDPESNTGIRKRYAAGELDFIVTVSWGREGLNEDIDTVVTVGKITSRLKFWQEIGRGTRLSKRFPITVYGHIFTPTTDRKAQSLFGLFGFEEIEQGVIIGKKMLNGEIADMEDDVDVDLRRHDDGEPRPPSSREPSPEGIPLSAFPDRIRDLISSMHAKTVGEATFHSNAYTHVPEEYKSFENIMENVPGAPATIRKHLRNEKGFAAIGRRETTHESHNFVFYFEPAAAEYLKTFHGAVARVTLQREFGGVDVSIVDAMADECNIKPINWFHFDGKFIQHYVKHDVERIRAKFTETPPADPTDYSRAKLAAATGMVINTLTSRLLSAELAQIKRKRTVTANGKIRVLDHWSKHDGEAIVERIKDMYETGGVPLYLVPQDLATRFIRAQKNKLVEFADSTSTPSELVRIARSGRPPRCVHWDVVRRAEEHFGTRHADIHIDYDRLPASHKDRDPAKLAYAQEVLARLNSLPTKFARK